MRVPNEIDRLLADPSVITAAWHEATLKLLLSHQATGDPVIVWRDGHVVSLDQQEIARLIEELTREQTASPPQAA